MFGTWRDLTHFYQISDLLAHFNVSDDVWNGFLHQIGPLGEDVRLLAALPRLAIVAACSNALHGDGSAFVPVDATQVGLVWRMAQRVMAFRAGVAEENFTEEDPWSQSSPSTTTTSTTPGPTSSGSGVKERVLKMSSLVDQQDESELVPPTPDQVHGWVQNFVKIMGSMPDEIEEPTGNQLAGLAKRVISQGGSPYVDFAVWVPFERKLAKNHKFRIYTPLGDGSFLQRDLPGPASFQAWTASWRVFRAACLMLNISSLAALETYFRQIEKMVVQWPQCWGLVYAAEDNARADKWEKWRRFLALEQAAGRQTPRDWDPGNPWPCVMVSMAKDDQYWQEKVHIPAAAWLAAGGKGAPVVANEASITAHFLGTTRSEDSEEGHKGDKKRNSLREKRKAKRKKQALELKEFKAQKSSPSSSNHQNKGKGKGKSKDQSGAQLCYSWASAAGTCANVPPGGECKGSIKRVHKCRKCLSPSHQDHACTA